MTEFETKIHLADESATQALAARIADILASGDIITLIGGLGVGKSVFARTVIRALGCTDEEIPSPTFSLVQTYFAGGLLVHHFDLYRLENEHDAQELGIDDAFAAGVSLIEWPDRLGAYLPLERLDIRLEIGDEEGHRYATLYAPDNWHARLREIGLG